MSHDFENQIGVSEEYLRSPIDEKSPTSQDLRGFYKSTFHYQYTPIFYGSK